MFRWEHIEADLDRQKLDVRFASSAQLAARPVQHFERAPCVTDGRLGEGDRILESGGVELAALERGERRRRQRGRRLPLDRARRRPVAARF